MQSVKIEQAPWEWDASALPDGTALDILVMLNDNATLPHVRLRHELLLGKTCQTDQAFEVVHKTFGETPPVTEAESAAKKPRTQD